MAQRDLYPLRGVSRREGVICAGTLTLGSSGAVATNVDQATAGFTVAKVGSKAGRYRCTFDNRVRAIFLLAAVINGAADAAYTTDKGLSVLVRNKTVGSGYIDIQFVKQLTDTGTSTYVDAEIADSLTVDLAFLIFTV